MAKSVRANLQLASINDVKDIISIDAKEVSSQPEQYAKANLLGYYVLVNTWLMLIKQWSEYGWIYVLREMTTYGLFHVIRVFDLAAQQVVNGVEVTSDFVHALLQDIQTRGSINGIPQDERYEFYRHPIAACLFILRYGKRFSPLKADLLRKQALEGFVSLQKDMKVAQRTFELGHIRPYLREAISGLVNWNRLCDELEAFDLTDLVFTPGVSFDTNADLVSKLKSVAKGRVEYFPTPFGIPLLAHTGCEEAQYYGKYNQYEAHVVRISAVPKNYKTARIIAPEEVIRQATARRYFQIMDKYTPSVISLHDQTVNQTLALEGSRDGLLATIDLSSASDRICWPLLEDLLPPRFTRIIRGVLPTHFMYNEDRRLLQSAATMGNSITFWLESVIFAGIALAGVNYFHVFDPTERDTVSVYGDDIIVPTEAADTVVEFLEKCGFVVNHDKSFTNLEGHFYRESCGEEYYDGVCTSSLYFPRFPLEGSFGQFSDRPHRDGFKGTVVDTMASMIDLQHKMYYSCVPAALLLEDLIREADPKMTSSRAGAGFSDLFAYTPHPTVVPAPAGEWVNGTLKRKVVPGQTRDGHSACIWVPKVRGKTVAARKACGLSEEEMLMVDLYTYQQFLKHGPRYDSPLDELLGITSPPIDYAGASLNGSLKWVLIK